MAVVACEFDDGVDEAVQLVKRVKNVVARNSNGGRTGDAAFHFDKPQLAGTGQVAFDVYDNSTGARGIDWVSTGVWTMPVCRVRSS